MLRPSPNHGHYSCPMMMIHVDLLSSSSLLAFHHAQLVSFFPFHPLFSSCGQSVTTFVLPLMHQVSLVVKHALRGFAKLKFFQKSKKNWIELIKPTHPPSKLFFWKAITDMDRTLKS